MVDARHPVPTVGVVCLKGEAVLLIRRGTPPRLNQWSLPGGRLEWGETTMDAALREHDREDGQYEVNRLTSCLKDPREIDMLALKRRGLQSP